jgi:type I restriction enzyme, S subunit
MSPDARPSASDGLPRGDNGLALLPLGWTRACLGEIVAVRGEKLAANPKSDLPFIGMDDVEPNALRATSSSLFRKMKSTANAAMPGDILYGRLRPYLNKVALAGARAAVSAEFIVLRPYNGIDARFVQYALHDRRFVNFATQDTSGDRPRIDFAKISTYGIALPPSAEQRRIVGRIDELFAEIAEGEAALERSRRDLDTWRRALLKAAVTGELTREWREANRPSEAGTDLLARIRADRVAHARNGGRARAISPPVVEDSALPVEIPAGWIWTTIGELFDVYTGSTPSRAEPAYWGGEIAWVSSGEVAFCRITKTRESITRAGLGNALNRVHPAGTVLLAMIGEGKTRGQCAILDIAACNNQNSAAIRVSATDIDPAFVYLLLEERYLRSRRESQGGNQPALNAQKVSSIPLPLPSVAEIHEIVRLVETARDEMGTAQREHSALNRLQSELRQSILKAAFEGRLVAQHPSDEPASALLARLRASNPPQTRLRGRGRQLRMAV